MTKDEIKLVTFILFAVLVGAAAQWWGNRSPHSDAPLPTPAPRGWAKPPYVFKNRKDMEKAAEGVKAPASENSAVSR